MYVCLGTCTTFTLQSKSSETQRGPLAQSAERRADNAEVVSSRLTWTNVFINLRQHLHQENFYFKMQ